MPGFEKFNTNKMRTDTLWVQSADVKVSATTEEIDLKPVKSLWWWSEQRSVEYFLCRWMDLKSDSGSSVEWNNLELESS